MEKKRIRKPAVAGTWYPGTEADCRVLFDTWLGGIEKQTADEKVLGLISPHAGYAFSGPAAARAYKEIEGLPIKTAVVLAPMHRMSVSRYMTSAEQYYETPMGLVEIDSDIVGQLKQRADIQAVSGDSEHSLEIQLPFLQYALKDFKLVPVMVGHGNVFDVDDMALALAEVLDPETSIIVASSDMHHIDDYALVEKRDAAFIRALEEFSVPDIQHVLSRPATSICGRVPITIMLKACSSMGAEAARILLYTHSSEITGKKVPGEYTVGYLAAAVTRVS